MCVCVCVCVSLRLILASMSLPCCLCLQLCNALLSFKHTLAMPLGGIAHVTVQGQTWDVREAALSKLQALQAGHGQALVAALVDLRGAAKVRFNWDWC